MTSRWKRPSGGAWGGGSEASLWSWALCLSCHCKSPLPASCPSAALSRGPQGQAVHRPRGLPTGPRIPPPCPSSPLAMGADISTPGMALLKVTFNQSWNYHADGCSPRNQSGSRWARLAGARASPPPELHAGLPYKTPAECRGLESQCTSFH